MIKFLATHTHNLVIEDISNYLIKSLEKYSNTLWLVSGGSNIPIEVAIMKKLPSKLTSKLIIALVDERFNKINHPDSNFKQLIQSGFNIKNATLLPIITTDNEDIVSTTKNYNQTIRKLFKEKDTNIIAQLGIGEDGHIAGLLPNSKALTSKQLVDYFNTTPFNRITLTPRALAKINQIFVIAINHKKDITIKTLFDNQNANPKIFPATILQDFPSVYVYNRLIEGQIT